MLDLMKLLPDVIDIAKAAGESSLQLQTAKHGLSIHKKSDDSPVTNADLAAHDIIVRSLKKLTPDIPILSEEDPNIPFTTRQQWQQYWLVDPLDGTREYISGKGEFTVNIAFIDQQKARLGIIHAPISKRCYYAVEQFGAYKQTGNQSAISIHTSQYTTNTVRVVVSHRSSKIKLDEVLRLYPNAEIKHASSALKFCMVAEGLADIYPRFSPTSEWDSAAGQCIVEQAGGTLTKLDFQPFMYNTKDCLLNPYFIVFSDAAFIDEQLKAILQSYG